MLKKRKLLILVGCFLSLVILLAIIFFSRNQKGYNSMDEFMRSLYDIHFVGITEVMEFNYDGLVEFADVIALVRATDELSTENSYESEISFYSLRNVEVIQYFKDNEHRGSSFQVYEKCYMRPGGTVLAREWCYPMLKDEYYLLFLSPTYVEGTPPTVISLDLGKVSLNHMAWNTNHDIASKAAINLLSASGMPEDIAALFLQSEPLTILELQKGPRELEEVLEVYTLSTGYEDTDEELKVIYGTIEGEPAFQVGDTLFR